jgi:tRNA dimethylallyltransferase
VVTLLLQVLVICGPTSAGKTEIAVLVAEAVGGEIVNADSRQVYRDLSIGTRRPRADLQQRVPHHLYGFVDPCVRYSAGEYVEDALAVISDITARERVPIVVGGTGLYIETLAGTMPLDRPVADDDIRERVRYEARTHPHEFLREWLDIVAPAAGKRFTRGDRYRTLRSLESALVTQSARRHRSTAEGAKVHRDGPRHMQWRFTVLELERAALRVRIVDRVRWMYESGLAEEAIAVSLRCPNAPALSGIGYAEVLAWHRGEATRDEAIDRTVARTLRYAKRQQTWFRRLRDAVAVHASDTRAAAAAIVRTARETRSST